MDTQSEGLVPQFEIAESQKHLKMLHFPLVGVFSQVLAKKVFYRQEIFSKKLTKNPFLTPLQPSEMVFTC
jgi:hypothetical protein